MADFWLQRPRLHAALRPRIADPHDQRIVVDLAGELVKFANSFGVLTLNEFPHNPRFRNPGLELANAFGVPAP